MMTTAQLPITPWLTIVGIGESGWAALGAEARAAITEAHILFGGERHLALLAADFPAPATQQRIPWCSPFHQAVAQLLTYRGTPVTVLASGDPLWFGIGSTLAAQLPPAELRILPAPSAMSLAAARLGWALQHVRVIAAHGRPLDNVALHLADGAQLLVLAADEHTPAQLAALVTARGYGASRLTVFERIGGAAERRVDGIAANWAHSPGAALNLIAVECVAVAGAMQLSRRSGLPDAAYQHDGQLTKRDARALTLARLAPQRGQLLWDVGAGCGSIGIEWMRADDGCRAIAIEANAARLALLAENCRTLGVPELQIVAGHAPEALAGLEPPDAVFIGGGLTVAGVFESCWAALKPNGVLVANAVTLQSEAALVGLRAQYGGELTRLSVAQAAPLGRFDGWRSAMPITLYTVRKNALSISN
ncbi:precorrin-6y C5,15-methyltransferase (decarboxylating) subunit CbiE [Chromatium okenii]|jgi:precorrin-6Y C5,15-methyltransferase (decarboxylating)|uniref:precorrin-6y C5,15-methyltransferase (decarboxylating) subunit CbiE n=1 Tax=Chromatium okenii TaxID=61644 RepID=UPI0026F2DC33|nr:precorrin-6y C5,15-methyltransferase (decarboxylating) subunit CbiE [Chromatium okenii]MBV5309756.1 precorrin-6y C5,15-methyltransferase (decarboxylating) subunit CbiE [Chromatium okenii]